MPVRISGSPNLGFRGAIVLGVALAIAPTPVLAEIQVGGSPEAVTIEARDASVEEVLATLSRAFDMDYHSSIDLDKRLARWDVCWAALAGGDAYSGRLQFLSED
jgi:hypothetical protein